MRQRKKLEPIETTAPEATTESKKKTTKKVPEPVVEAAPKSRAQKAVAKAVDAVTKAVTRGGGRKKVSESAAAPVEAEIIEKVTAMQEETAPKLRRPARGKKDETPAPTPAPEPEPAAKPARGGRGRSKAVVKTEPEPEVEEEESYPFEIHFRKPEGRPSGRQQGRQEKKPARQDSKSTAEKRAAPAPAEDIVHEDDPFLMGLLEEYRVGEIIWRKAEGRAKPAPRAKAPVEEAKSDEPQAAPRERRGRDRGRNRRDRDRTETPVVAMDEPLDDDLPVVFRSRDKETPVEAPPKIEVPVIPQKPVKPLIPIPADAPQIVLRDGIPTLVRNHRVYPPIAFFGGARDEARAEIVLNEMRMAGEAGVHLHSHIIEFDVDPESVDATVSVAAYLLKKTVEVDPEAQVLFRLVFIAPNGWQDKYPNARYQDATGQLADPSVCDDAFWDVARDSLADFSAQLRKVPMAENILGLHLDRGEWFNAQDAGYDTSRAARAKFQDWARMRYFGDIVALRASWFDGAARFEDLPIPDYTQAGKTGKFVRANRKERSWVDYHLFLSDQTVERIGELAYAAKEGSEGYFLIGVSYGYTFEWSHPASGHLSLGKLLRTPEIDFIAGPPSYRNREPGGSASFPGPIDSFALNGKLYLSEEDFKTSIGAGFEPDDFNPMLKTPQALDSVHWRGVGAALAHNSGVCWMDLWGNGWLKTPSTWERASRVRDAFIRRMSCPTVEPDVAVFIDERSLAYLVDQQGFSLLVQNVRESVMRAGMSAGFYLLSDLQHRENFPESKLYVFLNAWDIRPELRAAIKQRLQKDDKVLFWLYSAGLFDSGRESLERAREVTGIALKPQPFHSRTGTTILNRRHPLCEALPDQATIGGTRLEPSYFAIPDEGVVLGEYTQTGLPSFVFKQFRHDHDRSQHWSSVFLGEPIVTPGLLRALGQMAGAHVWNFTEDVVHVRAPFLTIHCTGTGQRTITLPQKWSAYDVTEQVWVSTDSTSLRFHATDGSTHVFMVGVREELEHILSIDPQEVLHMERIERPIDNTARADSSFDVPIMRLDEWMEGAEGEENIAEDLLFKPRLIEEEVAASVEEPNRVGRRRRRGRGRGGSEETANPRREGTSVIVDDESGLGVMFRKRD